MVVKTLAQAIQLAFDKGFSHNVTSIFKLNADHRVVSPVRCKCKKSLPYIFAQSLEDDPMNVVTIPVCSKCGKDYPKKNGRTKS